MAKRGDFIFSALMQRTSALSSAGAGNKLLITFSRHYRRLVVASNSERVRGSFNCLLATLHDEVGAVFDAFCQENSTRARSSRWLTVYAVNGRAIVLAPLHSALTDRGWLPRLAGEM